MIFNFTRLKSSIIRKIISKSSTYIITYLLHFFYSTTVRQMKKKKFLNIMYIRKYNVHYINLELMNIVGVLYQDVVLMLQKKF